MDKSVFENRRIIWEGRPPGGNERFRIVDCGPPREGKNDAQYVLEICGGHDALGVERWNRVSPAAEVPARRALMAALLTHLVPEYLELEFREFRFHLASDPVTQGAWAWEALMKEADKQRAIVHF